MKTLSYFEKKINDDKTLKKNSGGPVPVPFTK